MSQVEKLMRFVFAGLVAMMIGFVPNGHEAHAGSLAGTWAGGGYLQPAGGGRERASCRVIYRKAPKRRFSAVAYCATTSISISQTAALRRVKKNHYAGNFYNAQYGVSGRIYVVVKGRRQSVSLRSSNGRARLSLRRR